jgi:hypothetical protein
MQVRMDYLIVGAETEGSLPPRSLRQTLSVGPPVTSVHAVPVLLDFNQGSLSVTVGVPASCLIKPQAQAPERLVTRQPPPLLVSGGVGGDPRSGPVCSRGS